MSIRQPKDCEPKVRPKLPQVTLVTLRSPPPSLLLRRQHWFAAGQAQRPSIRSRNLRNGSSEVGARQAHDQDRDPDCTFHGWSPCYRASDSKRDTNTRSRIIRHASSLSRGNFVLFAPASDHLSFPRLHLMLVTHCGTCILPQSIKYWMN